MRVVALLGGSLLLSMLSNNGAAAQDTTTTTTTEGNSNRLHNWMWTYDYTPVAITRPTNAWELSQVVQDTKTYPSPLRAYGSMHSPSQCVVNEEGTVVNMTAFKAIKGLATDSKGRTVVTAEAGVTLLELHTWLGKQDREIPFIPDIGDATVGSLAVSVSKDATVGDPSLTGSFYKAVTGVTYVDHVGRILTLTDTGNATDLAAFKSSDGMLGIVTEVTLVTLPAQLVVTKFHVIPTADVIPSVKNGSIKVDADHAVMMGFGPEYTLLRITTKAPEGMKETSADLKNFTHATIRDSIAGGRMKVFTLDAKGASLGPVNIAYYKGNMASHYDPVVKGSKRGDGTWYELPFEKFEVVITSFLTFLKDFKEANNGFESTGAAVFFVQRIPDKPYGWFSQKGRGFDKPGLSFTLDSLTDTPDDPVWPKFLQENNAFVAKHGGRFSLTQTRFVTRSQFLSAPGQKPLPDSPNSRFASAYFRQYLAKEPPKAAAAAAVAAPAAAP